MNNRALGVITLILFCIVSYLVHLGAFTSLDLLATAMVQSIVPKFIDTVLSVVSVLGNFEVTVIFLLLLFYRDLPFLLHSGIALGITQIVELIGKKFLQHPGPPDEYLRYSLPFVLPTTYVKPGYSYPSGHSLRMLFLAILAYVVIKKSQKIKRKKTYIISLLLATIIMLVSRVSLGEHWLSDVIGGSLLGSSGAFFLLSIREPHQRVYSK